MPEDTGYTFSKGGSAQAAGVCGSATRAGSVHGMQGASGKLSPSAVCWTVCSCSAARSTKRSPHHTHLNCVSRECTLWCLARCSRCLKLLSQLAHLKGFSPVWTLRWRCSSEEYLKRFSQSGHLSGFSRWVRSCCLRSDGRLKLFPQEPQRNGLSPSGWHWWCDDWLKLLSQVSHLYGFSPVWTRSWRVSSDKWRKALWHTEHLYGRSGAEASYA
uniref:Uncharacterized protein n=1 Tax=Takifugu rubripes TaxID=31033 RepID=A0A3B5KHK1_TAKRU